MQKAKSGTQAHWSWGIIRRAGVPLDKGKCRSAQELGTPRNRTRTVTVGRFG